MDLPLSFFLPTPFLMDIRSNTGSGTHGHVESKKKPRRPLELMPNEYIFLALYILES